MTVEIVPDIPKRISELREQRATFAVNAVRPLPEIYRKLTMHGEVGRSIQLGDLLVRYDGSIGTGAIIVTTIHRQENAILQVSVEQGIHWVVELARVPFDKTLMEGIRDTTAGRLLLDRGAIVFTSNPDTTISVLPSDEINQFLDRNPTLSEIGQAIDLLQKAALPR